MPKRKRSQKGEGLGPLPLLVGNTEGGGRGASSYYLPGIWTAPRVALATRGGWAAPRVKWCAAHFTLGAASPHKGKRGAPFDHPTPPWVQPITAHPLLRVQPQIVMVALSIISVIMYVFEWTGIIIYHRYSYLQLPLGVPTLTWQLGYGHAGSIMNTMTTTWETSQVLGWDYGLLLHSIMFRGWKFLCARKKSPLHIQSIVYFISCTALDCISRRLIGVTENWLGL